MQCFVDPTDPQNMSHGEGGGQGSSADEKAYRIGGGTDHTGDEREETRRRMENLQEQHTRKPYKKTYRRRKTYKKFSSLMHGPSEPLPGR